MLLLRVIQLLHFFNYLFLFCFLFAAYFLFIISKNSVPTIIECMMFSQEVILCRLANRRRRSIMGCKLNIVLSMSLKCACHSNIFCKNSNDGNPISAYWCSEHSAFLGITLKINHRLHTTIQKNIIFELFFWAFWEGDNPISHFALWLKKYLVCSFSTQIEHMRA